MKKILTLMLVLAVCVSAFAFACAEPVEVELWHYFDSSNDKDMINKWVDDYNALQDKIHITSTYVSRQELMNQYAIGAISGELPDIGMVDSPDMASFISLGVFADITDQLNAWG
ncbi:MAG: ABC transporter substrate-binding protein, partial [Clostridia bacterium]|nr:ABC transporter substrate-binding protein [Clostridia bacterium]MBO5535172.1 ABC transporter substrate-binding protein [Clostridia bacterium]